MKKTIETIKKIIASSNSIEESSLKLTKVFPRLSKQASVKVLLDVYDFIEGDITENELSLFLVADGFVNQ